MTFSLWTKNNGKVIIDGFGKIISCELCPCVEPPRCPNCEAWPVLPTPSDFPLCGGLAYSYNLDYLEFNEGCAPSSICPGLFEPERFFINNVTLTAQGTPELYEDPCSGIPKTSCTYLGEGNFTHCFGVYPEACDPEDVLGPPPPGQSWPPIRSYSCEPETFVNPFTGSPETFNRKILLEVDLYQSFTDPEGYDPEEWLVQRPAFRIYYSGPPIPVDIYDESKGFYQLFDTLPLNKWDANFADGIPDGYNTSSVDPYGSPVGDYGRIYVDPTTGSEIEEITTVQQAAEGIWVPEEYDCGGLTLSWKAGIS